MTDNKTIGGSGKTTNYGRAAYEKAVANEKKIALSGKDYVCADVGEIEVSQLFSSISGSNVVKAAVFKSNGEAVKISVETTSDSVEERIYLNGKEIHKTASGETGDFAAEVKCKYGVNTVVVEADGITTDFTVTLKICGKVEKAERIPKIEYLGRNLYYTLCDDVFTIYLKSGQTFTEKISFGGVEKCSAALSYYDLYVYFAIKTYSGKCYVYRFDSRDNDLSMLSNSLNFKNAAVAYTDGIKIYYTVGGQIRLAFANNKGITKQDFTKRADEVISSLVSNGYYVFVKTANGIFEGYKISNDGKFDKNTRINVGNLVEPKMRLACDGILYLNGAESKVKNTCGAKIDNGRLAVGQVLYDVFPVAETETEAVGIKDGKPYVFGKVRAVMP